MTGRDMTDAEVGAELRRLNLNTEDSLRLLAESQRALGEIAEKLDHADSIRGNRFGKDWGIIKDVILKIARTSWKEGKT